MSLDVEQVIREYIDKSVHMSLGTTANDKPWVCEVHFVYDDDLNLYWRSEATRRHSQEIATNPNVAGNIVKQHTAGEGPHGVYFEGKAEQLKDEAEIQSILPAFTERLGVKPEAAEEAKRPDGTQFYKATIENWYAFGKFSEFGGEKYVKHELPWNRGKR